MRKVKTIEEVAEAAKVDSGIEVELNGRILQFVEPYRESLRRFGGDEAAMAKHRASLTKTLGFNIFNTKGDWYVHDVTDCRTQKKEKREKVDAFLLRTVRRIGTASSIEAAIQKAKERV